MRAIKVSVVSSLCLCQPALASCPGPSCPAIDLATGGDGLVFELNSQLEFIREIGGTMSASSGSLEDRTILYIPFETGLAELSPDADLILKRLCDDIRQTEITELEFIGLDFGAPAELSAERAALMASELSERCLAQDTSPAVFLTVTARSAKPSEAIPRNVPRGDDETLIELRVLN